MQYFLDRQYLCACRGHDHSDRAGKSQHDGYWDSAADSFRFLLKIEYLQYRSIDAQMAWIQGPLLRQLYYV